MKTLFRTLLGVSPAEEVRRARTEMVRTRHERGADSRATAEEVRAAMAARVREPHVTLGQATGGTPYHLALHTLRGAHGWVSGSTGSGKTTLAAHLVGGLHALQLAGAPISIVVLGLQGNFVELVLDAFAANLGRVPPARATAALEHLLVARFFRGDFVPAWNLLARAPGVPSLLQANALAEVLENSLGSAMGHRQETALAMLLALAIDEGLTLPELRLHLAFPEALARRGATASDPIVRSYFGNRFLKEGPATLDGLGSRFDRLLGLDDALRGALAARETIDFARCCTPGCFSVFDFAATPLGAEGARRALAALVLQSLAQAFVSASRPVRGATFVFIDEAQLALTPATTRTLETLVATVRQFGVALWFVNQSLVQLPREFIHLLSTNLTYRFLGRSGREDGTLSTAFLPRPVRATSRGQRAGASREGTPREDSEEALLARLGTLPSRHFYVTDRTTSWGAQEVEVARFAPPSRERLPLPLRTALARGATGRPRAELIAEGAALEARTMATLEAAAPASSSRIARRAPSTATPDVASLGRRWGRRSS